MTTAIGEIAGEDPPIVGCSEGMKSVLGLVKKVAQTSGNVLISGESGTGKELVARAIHAQSSRAQRPFVAINCAAISKYLMESEVFGHEKGAFSGAHRNYAGKFAYAAGGAVFLDEISCMDMSLQAKLLRFLQDRQVTPVGSIRSTRVDVRILAATNTRLEELVRHRKFRQDLYFRLNVLPIHLPPLRHRKGDIKLLAGHFLKRIGTRLDKRVNGFSAQVMEMLEAYHWPGNVRELENLVERLVAMGTDGRRIEVHDLPGDLIASAIGEVHLARSGSAASGLAQARRAFERQYILKTLESCGWNQSAAARRLKIHRNTLIQKMRTLEITALRSVARED